MEKTLVHCYVKRAFWILVFLPALVHHTEIQIDRDYVPGQHEFHFKGPSQFPVLKRTGPGRDRGTGAGRTVITDPEFKPDP
jgi:hypothetical protein